VPGAAVERIVRIEPFDAATADPGTAAAYADLVAETREWMAPGGFRPPAEYVLNRLRNRSPGHVVLMWNAWDGARLAGTIESSWRETPDNRDRSWVHADVRDQAAVPLLFAAAAAHLVAAGRPLLVVEALPGSPEGAWVAARGRFGATDLHNVLRLASVARADVTSLAATAPAGYEALTWDLHAPGDLLPALARLVNGINDAPTDDLTQEPSVWTPERVRAWEDGCAARGHGLWTVVARHVASGELAAYTQLEVRPEWPQVVSNQDTVVAPPHRGRGLGLWIKALNLLRVLDGPAEVVDTWNAASNAHMLRVNRRLGFVTQHEVGAWEVDGASLLTEVPA